MFLLLLLALVILLVIFLSVRFKLHPVFSLVFAALICGVLLGNEPGALIDLLKEGFGGTLAEIGLVIAFGTIIGIFMEKNGSMQALASAILKLLPSKWSPLAMNAVGFVISVPVFCDSGFIILSSLNKVLSRKSGIPLVVFAVCLSTGLYATHVFVPPTPGPLAAAAILGAEVGLVMMIGIMVAIPVAFAGAVWGFYLNRSIGELPKQGKELSQQQETSWAGTPLTLTMLLPVIIPILFIAMGSVAEYADDHMPDTVLKSMLQFLGAPVMALLLGAVIALVTTVADKAAKTDWVGTALKDAGSIIIITGAGGAFGNVLRSADLGALLQSEFNLAGSGLLIAFILAAILKSAQGSSTVAIITTAAILSPMLTQLGVDTPVEKALTVLAVGAGALTVSHVNDSYFWVVSQFSDLSVKQALSSHTLATGIQGLCGITILLVLQFFFG
ncbi:GntP family permease [Robertkochia marina]|uniref:GntP family permease n=1 Tax=Robertkochia marina TaxID=1227945 RepID=A0A4S3M359_9FLAO|nr:GntP family permease [Robertkochia marina]THD68079.1 GntP family permease [Robertkochia marina]TRZ42635.1 GntP family permease [Robertkochia marina]